MATPTTGQTSALPKDESLSRLTSTLEDAVKLYGSAKNYARMAIENPAEAARCAAAAKDLTGPLRQIQTLA